MKNHVLLISLWIPAKENISLIIIHKNKKYDHLLFNTVKTGFY